MRRRRPDPPLRRPVVVVVPLVLSLVVASPLLFFCCIRYHNSWTAEAASSTSFPQLQTRGAGVASSSLSSSSRRRRRPLSPSRSSSQQQQQQHDQCWHQTPIGVAFVSPPPTSSFYRRVEDEKRCDRARCCDRRPTTPPWRGASTTTAAGATGDGRRPPPRVFVVEHPATAPLRSTSSSLRLWSSSLSSATTATEEVEGTVPSSATDDDDDDKAAREEEIRQSDGADAALQTSAVFNVTYDGTHYHGWSAANDGAPVSNPNSDNDKDDVTRNSLPPKRPPGRRNRRRRKGLRIPHLQYVRSVEGTLKSALAKIYGNVDASRVIVEGCSRTDKGVHARGIVALIYCLTEEAASEVTASSESESESEEEITANDSSSSSTPAASASAVVPGKRLPHPTSPTDDTSFVPLPFSGNLTQLSFVLNRMLPPDVRIAAVSRTPIRRVDEMPKSKSVNGNDVQRPFHPSLDAIGKTYLYAFSTGHMHDPLRWRHVWHVNSDRGGGIGNKGRASFDLEAAREAASLLKGTHDFVAFRGAFRGNDRNRVQNDTVCTIYDLTVELESEEEEEVEMNVDWSDAGGKGSGGGEGVFSVDGLAPPLPEFVVGGTDDGYDDDLDDGEDKEGEGGEEVDNKAPAAPRRQQQQQLRTYAVRVTGDRFLYKMVRNLVGTIVAVGCGAATVDDVRSALDTGRWGVNVNDDDKQVTGNGRKQQQQMVCAPAHGLVLDCVYYGNDVEFDWM